MNVIVRPQFYLDLQDEALWLLTNAGVNVAQRWHDAVWQTIQLLQSSPQLGRERKDLQQPGIRSWRIKSFPRWLVFYSLRDEDLVVYRIRSGMMNLSRIEMQS